MKMSVPGDAGYEVSRFAEKISIPRTDYSKLPSKSSPVLCESCKFKYHNCPAEAKFPAYVSGKANTCCYYEERNPSSSPMLGETVMDKEQRDEVYDNLTGDYTAGDERKAFCKAQDSHTRKKLIEQGWKSPEEVNAILRAERLKEAELLTKLNAILKTGNIDPVYETLDAHIASLKGDREGCSNK